MLALLLVAPLVYYLVAKLHGEHFYRGLPTSYWSRKILKWSENKSLWSEPWPDRVLDYVSGRNTAPDPAVVSGDEAAIPVLVDLLHDKHQSVRQASIVNLGNCFLVSHPEVVVRALLQAPSDDAFWTREALHRHSLVSVRPLVQALKDEALAPEAIQNLRRATVEAALVLVQALDDPDPRVRRGAANALGHSSPAVILEIMATALPALRRAMDDEDEEVRIQAAYGVLRLEPKGHEDMQAQPLFFEALAALNVEDGRLEKATAWQQQAVDTYKSENQKERARQRLVRYQHLAAFDSLETPDP
jgi:hypothetical protein